MSELLKAVKKYKGKVQVLSPDGITLEIDKPNYKSGKLAVEAFENWKKRYEHQGYYSTRGYRILLADLADECEFIKV